MQSLGNRKVRIRERRGVSATSALVECPECSETFLVANPQDRYGRVCPHCRKVKVVYLPAFKTARTISDYYRSGESATIGVDGTD